MKSRNLVCLHEYESLDAAEAARMILEGSGIGVVVQGAQSASVLGTLAPMRVPLMVDAENVASAREVLQRSATPIPGSRFEGAPLEASTGTRFRAIRTVFGFAAFCGLTGCILVIAMYVVMAGADALYSTPYGHGIRPIVPVWLFVTALSLLTLAIRWLRARMLYVIPIAALVFCLASLGARVAPATGAGKPSVTGTRRPW